MGRIGYRKICELDGQQLRDDEIIKGYEISKDTLVPVTDQDLEGMPLPTAKAIDIVAFVPAESIDPVRIGDSYYLEADGQVSAKPYKLLRQALERSGKVAVAKFALRGRERRGLLRVEDDALVLHSMHWPDEIRSPAELAPPPVDIGDSEVDGALALMDAMGQDDLSDYHDEYRVALEQVIAAKAEGKAPPTAGVQEPAGQVVDLMAALNESAAKKTASGRKPRAYLVPVLQGRLSVRVTAACTRSATSRHSSSAVFLDLDCSRTFWVFGDVSPAARWHMPQGYSYIGSFEHAFTLRGEPSRGDRIRWAGRDQSEYPRDHASPTANHRGDGHDPRCDPRPL
jgi:DNA end-binding protein Ku